MSNKIMQLQFTFSCYNVDVSDDNIFDRVDRILTRYSDGRYDYLAEILQETAERIFKLAIAEAIEKEMFEIYKNEMVPAIDGNGLTSKALIEASNKLRHVKIYIQPEPSSDVKTIDEG